MSFSKRIRRNPAMRVRGFPLLLLGGCLTLARRWSTHTAGLFQRMGRATGFLPRYIPLILTVVSALLLSCGVAGWTNASDIGEMTLVGQSLEGLGQPVQLASLFRTLGITFTIAGGLLAVVMVRTDSASFQGAGIVTWLLVGVAGLAFAAGIGVFTQAEGLSTVSGIWSNLGIDITTSDAGTLLTCIGIVGTISGFTVLFTLVSHKRRLRVEQEALWRDRRSLGRIFFRLSLIGMSAAVLLLACLVCFHWLRGASIEGSVGMVIEDGKMIVGNLTDPKSLSTLLERLQGEPSQTLK